MDLYILNEIQKLKSGGGGASGGSSAASYTGIKKNDTNPNSHSWVSFSAVNARQHVDNYRWTNTHPSSGQNHYNYNAGGAYNHNASVLVPTGKMTSGAPTTGDQHFFRKVNFARHNAVGYKTDFWTWYSSNSYNPFMTNVMFIRNPTNADITVTMGWQYSQCWTNGYEGARLMLWTPNATGYSGVTGGSWSALVSTNGSNNHTQTTFSLTVPAGKTCMLMGEASAYEWTSAWNGYLFGLSNQIKGLTTAADAGLVCDLDLSQVYLQHNDNNHDTLHNSNDANAPYLYWQDAARMFPDP